MTAASRPVLIAALTFALAAHAGGIREAFGEDVMQMEGGQIAPPPSLGIAFADMVAGTNVPEPTEDITEPAEPVEDVTDPEEPETTVEETTPEEVEEHPTKVQEQPAEVEEVAEDIPVEDLIEMEIEPLPVETVVPILPMKPTEVQPTEVAQPAPAETLEAVEENTSAVASSLRPKPRTPEFEKKHEPPPPEPPKQVTQPRQQPRQQTTQSSQGAQQNSTAGVDTGVAQQRSNASQGTGNSTQQGNAAVSNYPGKVMRRLSRGSRPRGGFKGTARGAFRVSGSGGLAGVSLASSSGNAKLDQAALSMVRRAAPFPPPPPGAQTSFNINIQGR